MVLSLISLDYPETVVLSFSVKKSSVHLSSQEGFRGGIVVTSGGCLGGTAWVSMVQSALLHFKLHFPILSYLNNNYDNCPAESNAKQVCCTVILGQHGC